MRLLQWSNTVLCTLVLAGFHNQLDWALETHTPGFPQRLNRGGALTLTGQVSRVLDSIRRENGARHGASHLWPQHEHCPALKDTHTQWYLDSKKWGKRGDKARWALLLCFLSLWEVSKQRPSTSTGGGQSCSHVFPIMGAVTCWRAIQNKLLLPEFLCQVFCPREEKSRGYNIISLKYNPSTMEVGEEGLGIRGYTI